ncbi:MAG: site-specific integrase [Pseudomonadota bacterium]
MNVYRHENSRFWQCSTFLAGRNHRVSTKSESLAQAKEFAEDWYLELRGKFRNGEIKNEKTFKDASERFVREYVVLTGGERSPKYAKDHEARIRNHHLPFFGNKGLSEVTSGLVQDFRIHPQNVADGEKQPTRSTMHHEIVTLRPVLKTALRHGWISGLPDQSEPYLSSSKVTHRAWFSPDEYRTVYEATRKNITRLNGARHAWVAAQLHDKVLFMANTGIRPDEANWLEYRDVEIVEDYATSETILEIEVRGKRGVGYCKSTTGPVRPFQRMLERNNREPTDRLFPVDHKNSSIEFSTISV